MNKPAVVPVLRFGLAFLTLPTFAVTIFIVRLSVLPPFWRMELGSRQSIGSSACKDIKKQNIPALAEIKTRVVAGIETHNHTIDGSLGL
jgi:hypothetical protein